MSHKPLAFHLRIALLSLAVATAPSDTPAQASGGSYVLRKEVIANGGSNRASGGSWVLTGTTAQPLASVQSSGAYRLTGGFHAPRPAPAGEVLFANGFE